MKKYILNILTFGLYNRVDLMSQALIDAVAKQTIRNQELQKSIDDMEEHDFDDSVVSACDSYLNNNFCPSDFDLVSESDIDYMIDCGMNEVKDRVEDVRVLVDELKDRVNEQK